MKDQPAIRKLVRNRILGARTPTDITEAEALLDEWLAAHPDDEAVRIEASGLQRMKDALRLIDAGKGDERDPRKRVLS